MASRSYTRKYREEIKRKYVERLMMACISLQAIADRRGIDLNRIRIETEASRCEKLKIF